MEAQDFLTLALELQKSTSEASLRTSIGRAYYAIFNEICKCLREGKINLPKTYVAHVKAQQYLSGCGIPEAETLATTLDELRDARNEADYQLQGVQVEAKECRLHYMKAEMFFSGLKNIDKKLLIKQEFKE